VTQPWAWRAVLGALDTVRANAKNIPPSGPGAARGPRRQAPPSADPPGTPPIDVNPDMPGGPAISAGPPPPGQKVDIPAIERIYHDPAWLGTIAKGGFHNGALNGLAAAFR